MATPARLALTDSQRAELTEISQSRSLPAGYVFRAKLILMLAEGLSFNTIKQRLQTTAPTIIRWKERFLAQGTDGLDTFHPGQKPTVLTPALRAKILAATRKRPTDGFTHWSCRKLAASLDVSKDAVHRAWKGGRPQAPSNRALHGQQRSRLRKQSGRYHRPVFEPAAARRCLLRRREDRHSSSGSTRFLLPLSPGRAERHGFEYYRQGTLSLYAALDTKTGKVLGKTAARHTSKDFVEFLSEVVDQRPARQEIHIILDNLSAHKTQAVRDFLAVHPNVQLHFTPTYSSWLNQVEIWFSKIERDVIARGVFTSVQDLARKLRRYINAYSANAKPIQWKYSDPTRRIRTNDLSATGHSTLCGSTTTQIGTPTTRFEAC